MTSNQDSNINNNLTTLSAAKEIYVKTESLLTEPTPIRKNPLKGNKNLLELYSVPRGNSNWSGLAVKPQINQNQFRTNYQSDINEPTYSLEVLKNIDDLSSSYAVTETPISLSSFIISNVGFDPNDYYYAIVANDPNGYSYDIQAAYDNVQLSININEIAEMSVDAFLAIYEVPLNENQTYWIELEVFNDNPNFSFYMISPNRQAVTNINTKPVININGLSHVEILQFYAEHTGIYALVLLNENQQPCQFQLMVGDSNPSDANQDDSEN